MTVPVDSPSIGLRLAELFLRALPDRVLTAGNTELARQLEACWASGQTAWPGVNPAPAQFVDAIVERARDSWTPGSPLPAFHEDLTLAVGLIHGDRRATEYLEQILRSQEVLRALSSFEGSGLAAQDVLQAVREKLLLGTREGLPKIRSFQGQGSLKDWIRAVAVRTAIDLRRRLKPQGEDIEELELPVDESDPELAYLRKRHGAQLARAMRLAFDELSDREVNVLRMHVLDQLSVEAIAHTYSVNRTTVWRWITSATTNWVARTRALLMDNLTLNEPQMESLVRALQSGFHASLGRWLKET